MLQPKKPAKKAESTVIKPMAKKDRFKNLGGEIGNPPFPNGRKGMPYAAPTSGGAKNGKTMKKAKSGGSFPDLNKDGKITKADILKGRGVIAKSGAKMKKAQNGMSSVPRNSSGEVTVGGVNPYKTGGPKPSLSAGFKAGGKIKKCKTGCK